MCVSIICALVFFSGALYAEVINRIVAVVGNEIITEVDLNRAIASGGKGKESSRDGGSLKQETLDRMIDDALLGQLLVKSKIEVTDDDVARAIANVLHQNRISLDGLKGELESKGTSYDEYKKQMEREIKKIKFVNQVIGPQVKITDQDMRDYYQQNQERFRGSQQAHISQIIFPLEGIASQEEFDRTGETALFVAGKARHGSSFDSLAKQYSKGPNAANGGDLGIVNLKDLPLEVADAVRMLKVGEVSPPILTQKAIIIVKLISLPEISPGDFEKMRDDIYSALYDQKIEEALRSYLLKERQKAFVEIR